MGRINKTELRRGGVGGGVGGGETTIGKPW